MDLKATTLGWGRAAMRFGAALSAAALLLGAGAITPAARAQEQQPFKEVPNVQKPDDKVRGPLTIGDDAIDPMQPIKPSFILNVSVVGEPDPSGNYQVDPAGNVAIRYQGIQTPVSVKGMTPTQAADAIAKFLKTYIKSPQVTVSIVAIPHPTVFVGGAVRFPGPVIVTPETTLVELLSKVEWSENSDLSQVRITRHSKDSESKAIIVDFGDYIKVNINHVPDEKNNPILQDKDTVFVPFIRTPGTGQITVNGEVTKPLPNIPLRFNPPMTVREAISLVGGTTANANRKSISIKRAGFDRPLVIDLDKAEQGDLVNNIELKPDDAIYVERLENNAYINVVGGFIKTGKYVYDKRTTLTQIIMEAGGVAPYSKDHEGKVYRHPDADPKHTQIIAFNWGNIAKAKAPDIELQAGDSVYIQGGSPGRPVDAISLLGALGSAVNIYNQATGRFYQGLIH